MQAIAEHTIDIQRNEFSHVFICHAYRKSTVGRDFDLETNFHFGELRRRKKFLTIFTRISTPFNWLIRPQTVIYLQWFLLISSLLQLHTHQTDEFRRSFVSTTSICTWLLLLELFSAILQLDFGWFCRCFLVWLLECCSCGVEFNREINK